MLMRWASNKDSHREQTEGEESTTFLCLSALSRHVDIDLVFSVCALPPRTPRRSKELFVIITIGEMQEKVWQLPE